MSFEISTVNWARGYTGFDHLLDDSVFADLVGSHYSTLPDLKFAIVKAREMVERPERVFIKPPVVAFTTCGQKVVAWW